MLVWISAQGNITWIVTEKIPTSYFIKKQLWWTVTSNMRPSLSSFLLSSNKHAQHECIVSFVWYEAALGWEIWWNTCSHSHSSQEVKSQWAFASRKLIYIEIFLSWDCWANRQHQKSGLSKSRAADEHTHESETGSLSDATPPPMTVKNKIKYPK